jgi:hypothetical protein
VCSQYGGSQTLNQQPRASRGTRGLPSDTGFPDTFSLPVYAISLRCVPRLHQGRSGCPVDSIVPTP